MGSSWDDRVAAFWAAADDAEPSRLRSELDALLAERADHDPDALFERASLHDFLGEEATAIPLYRAALDAGLAPPQRTRARIQLASSLRNVHDPSRAIAALQEVPAGDPLADAAAAFRALALFDDAKPAAALRAALLALAQHLPEYRAVIERSAADLVAQDRIRAIAVGLVVRGGWILAEEYPASAHHAPFLRVPGGGIELGERADQTIRREFAEELGVEIEAAQLLGVSENLFALGPKRGHEIVFAYAVRCAALEALPHDTRLPVLDGDTTVGWYELDALGDMMLYPDGMPQLARSLAG